MLIGITILFVQDSILLYEYLSMSMIQQCWLTEMFKRSKRLRTPTHRNSSDSDSDGSQSHQGQLTFGDIRNMSSVQKARAKLLIEKMKRDQRGVKRRRSPIGDSSSQTSVRY